MTRADGNDGIGYVLAGYLDSEGPEGITVSPDYDGHPFATPDEAWAEVEANGGPLDNATIFVGVVLPVGIITQTGVTDEQVAQTVAEISQAFGGFYNVDEEEDED